MDILIVVLILLVTFGLLLFVFYILDGLLIVEPLEKLEYISQMGIVLAPCFVMSTDKFGEPYTLQTWLITIGLALGSLLVAVFSRIFIEKVEDYADKKQIKKQKKNKQKTVKNLLGRSAAKKFKDRETIEKVKDTNINSKPKEKRKIVEIIAIHLAMAKGSTLCAAAVVPIIIALNGGISKIIDPLCIMSVLLGLGVSFLCGWISNKLVTKYCDLTKIAKEL